MSIEVNDLRNYIPYPSSCAVKNRKLLRIKFIHIKIAPQFNQQPDNKPYLKLHAEIYAAAMLKCDNRFRH